MVGPLLDRARDTVKAVAPLLAVTTVLLVALVPPSVDLLVRVVGGGALVVVGMTLLFLGIDLGLGPMGRFIGAELPRRGSIALVAGVAFAIGLATTLAEPDVLVLATQVARASDGAISAGWLSLLIAAGVGIFAVLAILRVVVGTSMRVVLLVAYGVMLALSLVAPTPFVPLAYDAGSVTTGVLTAPVVLGLAIGFSAVIAGRNAEEDGFGILGVVSIGPVLLVLLLGMVLQ